MRWQSTWPSKDIFHEYALDFAKKVNDMTGGDLKIEVLPAGAVVPAFGLLDAVSKGTLDGGHGVLVYHYGKQNALALWGSGPAFGMDANMLLVLAQIRRRQGTARQALRLDRRQRRVVPLRADADAAARLVQEADHQGRATSRASSTAPSASRSTCSPAWARRSTRCPAARSCRRWTAACSTPPSSTTRRSDRLLGFPDVSKVCMLQSYHQNAEQFEIMFNKTKYDALPDKMKAIIDNAVEAASQDMSWKAIDRYSQDYIELQTKDKVKFYKTPDSILQKQLESLRPGRRRRGSGQRAVQGDHRVAEEIRRARGASGTSTPT